MYNVYKHWGSETAQYGLEILFKGTTSRLAQLEKV